jgi:signal transduction histidine kinase
MMEHTDVEAPGQLHGEGPAATGIGADGRILDLLDLKQMLRHTPANASRFSRLHPPDIQSVRLLGTPAARSARTARDLELRAQRAEQLVRETERVAERARILRDMHDGVGSHIATAIRQLETGNASHEEVLQTLRDSLDHLKLSIDTMNLPPGDISALLANLRYRLEPRFLACNIPWQWNVDLLEPIASLDEREVRQQSTGNPFHRRAMPRLMDTNAMRQLQFILMEALSNVLQHSQASMVCIAAHRFGPSGHGVRLQIIDNGRGFDVSQSKCRGLKSMHERADAINLKLRFSSVPGRTAVEMTLE